MMVARTGIERLIEASKKKKISLSGQYLKGGKRGGSYIFR
jgi:hypothetical protein